MSFKNSYLLSMLAAVSHGQYPVMTTKTLDLKGIEPRHMGVFLAPFTTARDQRRAAKKGKRP